MTSCVMAGLYLSSLQGKDKAGPGKTVVAVLPMAGPNAKNPLVG